MNKREIIVLVDTYKLNEVNPYINNILPYLVIKEINTMLPHVNLLTKSYFNIDRIYDTYIKELDAEERAVYNAFVKHMFNMVLYSSNKLDGVLDCVYKQKYKYIVLHLKERK